ncbi:MAG: 3'(2'),5'-bisphosphate nucleotidase CysQ [Pseudomonadota bacterium]
MPELEADLQLLVEAAEAAGQIAKRYFKQAPQIWDKGGDAGPVTEADLAIDRMLKAELTAARPDHGWLSEETEDTDARLKADRVFIVDPIDGTRAFIEGQSAFAHSLAIVENGVAVAGVVYLPAQDKMFAAASGQGATLNSEPILASRIADDDGATMLTTKPNLAPGHWPGGVPRIARAYRPSLAYRMALVGTGRFDGMMTLRPTWEWDIAAGAVIAAEAGARVTDGAGQALRLNNPAPQVDGVIAAGAGLHANLMTRRAA